MIGKGAGEMVGAGEVARWVKHLLSKDEDCGTEPQSWVQCVSAFVSNPSTGGVETGGSRGLAGQPVSLKQLAPGSVKDLTQNGKWRVKEKDIHRNFWSPTYEYTSEGTHTQADFEDPEPPASDYKALG